MRLWCWLREKVSIVIITSSLASLVLLFGAFNQQHIAVIISSAPPAGNKKVISQRIRSCFQLFLTQYARHSEIPYWLCIRCRLGYAQPVNECAETQQYHAIAIWSLRSWVLHWHNWNDKVSKRTKGFISFCLETCATWRKPPKNKRKTAIFPENVQKQTCFLTAKKGANWCWLRPWLNWI